MTSAPEGPAVGSSMVPAQLSLCAGGLVRTWSERGDTLWRVEDPEQLLAAMYEGQIARTPREERRFREVALLDEASGTLGLVPLIRTAGDSGTFAGGAVVARSLQVTPSDDPVGDPIADVVDGLRRAIAFTVASDGFLLVERGGWDAPATPYVLLVVTDGTLHVETSPAPVGSPVWEPFVREGAAGASVAAPFDAEMLDPATRLALEAVGTWQVEPWDLALTFGVR